MLLSLFSLNEGLDSIDRYRQVINRHSFELQHLHDSSYSTTTTTSSELDKCKKTNDK